MAIETIEAVVHAIDDGLAAGRAHRAAPARSRRRPAGVRRRRAHRRPARRPRPPVLAPRLPARAPSLPRLRPGGARGPRRLGAPPARAARGKTVRISEPRNTFALDPAAGSAVLVGAGIGLTPLLAMAEELVHAGLPFELHCYARSAAELPLREHIAARPYATPRGLSLQRRGRQRPRQRSPPAWRRPRPVAASTSAGRPGSSTTSSIAAGDAGWLDDQLRIERFQSQIAKITSDDGSFVVSARSTGEDYEIPADRTIAEVLEAAGVPIVLSCEQASAAPASPPCSPNPGPPRRDPDRRRARRQHPRHDLLLALADRAPRARPLSERAGVRQ